jgi:hypothetical protein
MKVFVILERSISADRVAVYAVYTDWDKAKEDLFSERNLSDCNHSYWMEACEVEE